jgi:hypothetical protein
MGWSGVYRFDMSLVSYVVCSIKFRAAFSSIVRSTL